MNYLYVSTIISLFLCIAPMPYSYYMLVRFLVIMTFGFMAITFSDANKLKMETCIVIIILFQPFVKIPLGRLVWNCIDVVAAIFLCYNLYSNYKQ